MEESVVEDSPAAVFRSRIISFSSFQTSPMLLGVSFLLNFTFPLLHMNRFDGTFDGSFFLSRFLFSSELESMRNVSSGVNRCR